MIKKVVFTFGRFNPPQKGHALVINKTVDLAKKLGAENRIYTSKSTDTNKNPIPYRDKIEILRQLFPNANIVDDPQAATAFHICKALSESEYDEVIMVVGSDRVREFKQSIGKYVKDRKDPDFSPQKNYGFSKFDVVSAGERDPDNEGVSGLSGTKMREFVRKDDFASFAKGIPTNNARLAKKVFDIIKKNLQEEFIINEDVTRDKFGPMLDSFVSFASDKLGLKSFPNFKYKDHDDDSKSFGGYNPSSEEIVIVTKNRHPMDIFRTVAHELVHHKQNGEGRIKDVEKEGATGSDIENEANSEAGKVMRWFAKANPALFKSSYVTEDTIKEGINDPSQHKAIFIAGGTGSGKDFVMNRTLRGHGLTEINSDTALEHLMKKSGLNLSMPKKEEKPRNIARGRAKNLTREKERLALSGGKGVIINGTADAPEKIARIKDELEKSGYQTKMLFVHASNRTSKKRNEDRGKLGQRRVKENIRAEKWKDAQKAKPTYIKMFGDEHFTHVDNSDDYNSVSPERKTAIDKEHANIFKSVRSFVSTPTDTPMASTFTQREVARRGITKLSPVRAHKLKENIEEAKKMRGSDPCWSGYKQVGVKKKGNKEVPNCVPVDEAFENMIGENESEREWGTTSLADIYKKDTPGQVSIPAPLPSNVKKKLKKKKFEKESLQSTFPFGYEPGNTGIGDEFPSYRFPYNASGGLGYGYSIPMSEESLPNNQNIRDWAMKEETQSRFVSKYGNNAGQKLLESAYRLYEVYGNNDNRKSRNLDEIRDLGPPDEKAIPAKSTYGDMSMIGGGDNKEVVEATPAWKRKEGKDPKGGLNRKGIASYRRENPGSKLSMAVTTPPSKLDPNGRPAKRRKSFCARMGGVSGPMKDEKGRLTRKALALRKWNCEE